MSTITACRPPTLTARNSRVEQNMPLARKVAHRFLSESGNRESYDDLQQIAFLGLIKAADRFNSKSGYAFSSFATKWIRGESLHSFRAGGSNPVRIPRSLYQSGHRAKIHSLDCIVNQHREINKEYLTLGDAISDYRQCELRAFHEEMDVVMRAIAQLDDLTRRALVLFYLRNFSRKEIAARLEISAMTVSRRLCKGVEQIREILELSSESGEARL